MKKVITSSTDRSTDPRIDDMKHRLREIAADMENLRDSSMESKEQTMLLNAYQYVTRAIRSLIYDRR